MFSATHVLSHLSSQAFCVAHQYFSRLGWGVVIWPKAPMAEVAVSSGMGKIVTGHPRRGLGCDS